MAGYSGVQFFYLFNTPQNICMKYTYLWQKQIMNECDF